jgi:hypothetical protein
MLSSRDEEVAMTNTDTSGGEARRRTPVHLWIVGVLALLWNLMGAFNYLATQLRFESYVAQLSDAELAFLDGYPAWATAGWAFAVWGALVATTGLLLRHKWSLWAYIVSLAGMAVSSVYSFGLSNAAELMGTGGVVFSLIIWLVAILLIIYTWRQTRTGVLH